MLNSLKNLFGGNTSLLSGSSQYPGMMAEMVEFLTLLQMQGTAPGEQKGGNLLRITSALSEDAYCLGYLTGMFESLCHQWEVPANEQRVIIGSAFTLLFRDLLENRCDIRHASAIEDAAFNCARRFANDPVFLRGKFDGCSELNRYTTTKSSDDMPVQLHHRLKQLVVAA